MTTVLLPYVQGMLRRETVTSVRREAASLGWSVVHCDLDPLDHEAYWALLTDWWDRHEDFVIVEQDVEPVEGSFTKFDECPISWCSNPYDCGTMTNVLALGCTRFRKEIMDAYPEAFRDAGEVNDSPSLGKRHWKRLDARLAGVLHQRRYSCHPHEPIAIHHHEYT